MFCPNCGTQNDEDALFCGVCGANLKENQQPVQPETPVQPIQPEAPVQPQMAAQPVQPQMAQPRQPKVRKPVSKLLFVTLGVAVLFIASIVAFFVTGNIRFGVKPTAQNFAEAVVNHDYKTMYSSYDLEESTFINEDNYVSTMRRTAAVNGYAESEAKITVKSTSDRGLARITYSDTGAEQEYYFKKDDSKNWLFFPNWVIDDTPIVKDTSIEIPSAATLYIDGTQVPDSCRNESDGYVTYNVPKLFKGYHVFEIKVEDMNCGKGLYDVSYDDNYYSMYSITLDEDTQKDVINIAYESYQKVIEALVDGKDYSEVKNLFVNNDSSSKDTYKSYQDSFYAKDGKVGITQVDISGVEAYVSSMGVDDEGMYVIATLNFDNSNKGYKQDWFTDNVTLGTDADNREYVDITLYYVDGEWLISDAYYMISAIAYNNYFYN